MRKSTCVQFFEMIMGEVSNGRGYRDYKNPALKFLNEAKSGKYNCISDEEYDTLLDDVQDLAKFWLDHAEQTGTEVFRTALEDIHIDQEALHKIAEILAECYQTSVHSFGSKKPMKTSEETKTADVPFHDGIDDEELTIGDDPFIDDLLEEYLSNNKKTSFMDDPFTGVIDGKELNSPQEIYHYLTKYIYGQKEAVKTASLLLYNHMQGRKRNVLFIGPTGCGKTEIWRACQKIYPNIRIIDGAMMTGEGWAGSLKAVNIFDNMNKRDAEKAIIVIDEFDKLCEPQIGSSGTNHSYILQNNLLKIIEGTELTLERQKNKETINTSKVSFVFCGSFETLTKMKTEKEKERSIGFGSTLEKTESYSVYENEIQQEDLIQYASIRQEIAGRINQIVQLSPMTADDYKKILKDEIISPLRQLERQYSVKLRLDKKTEDSLVKAAEETHLGVRFLYSRLQKMLDDQMFKDCSKSEYKLSA